MPAVVLGKPSPRAASPSPNGETEAHRREATWSGLGRPHVVLLPSALDSLRPDSRAGGGQSAGRPSLPSFARARAESRSCAHACLAGRSGPVLGPCRLSSST